MGFVTNLFPEFPGIHLRTVKTWVDGFVVARHPPESLRSGEEESFRHEFNKQFAPVKLHKFRDALVTAEGFVLKNGSVLPVNQVTPVHRKQFGWRYYLAQRIRKKQVRLDPFNRYALCYNYWSNVYFHWICDTLPRMHHLQTFDPSIVFLVPEEKYAGYARQSMEALGISRIEVIPKGCTALVPELFVLDHLAPTGNFHPPTMLTIRERLIKSPGVPGHRGIYASRAKARYKHVVNEQAVNGMLSDVGVETVYFEEMPFTEQVQVMQNTKLLIGMHGANLTNMLFMPSGGIVLEFREIGDKKNNCFYALADALGLHYYCLFCHRASGTYSHANRFDLEVEVNVLRDILQKLV